MKNNQLYIYCIIGIALYCLSWILLFENATDNSPSKRINETFLLAVIVISHVYNLLLTMICFGSSKKQEDDKLAKSAIKAYKYFNVVYIVFIVLITLVMTSLSNSFTQGWG